MSPVYMKALVLGVRQCETPNCLLQIFVHDNPEGRRYIAQVKLTLVCGDCPK